MLCLFFFPYNIVIIVLNFDDEQLNIVEGKMQYVFDETGRRYLDAFGGIATVSCGHSHPEIVNSVIKQLKLIQHSTILYLNHTISDFAEALVSTLPGDLKVKRKTNIKKSFSIRVDR